MWLTFQVTVRQGKKVTATGARENWSYGIPQAGAESNSLTHAHSAQLSSFSFS